MEKNQVQRRSKSKGDLKCECALYLQGSELAGWADGRYSFEGIDLNHNFPDLNNIMWDSQETAEATGERDKAPNHYIPIPEYYTQEDAMVRTNSISPGILIKIKK